MKFSTKGRYALRVMLDLSEHNSGSFITLADIAQRQEISEKYLESIVSVLSRNGLVEAVRGKGGGYRLNRSPDDYTVAEILDTIEGPFAPVACLECKNGSNTCQRSSECRTLKMWTGLQTVVNDYLSGITLGDLLRKDDIVDYVI